MYQHHVRRRFGVDIARAVSTALRRARAPSTRVCTSVSRPSTRASSSSLARGETRRRVRRCARNDLIGPNTKRASETVDYAPDVVSERAGRAARWGREIIDVDIALP
jgi:hypothetical protein